jgi:hypothetical protein
MAGQMNRHIRNFGLLCPFQSGFRRHHSTTTAVLKVTEDNLEDGQATVLVMLDFTHPFDMIAHDLMVCKMRPSQWYSDGATALLGSYLSDLTQCVRSDGENSTVRGIECQGLYLAHFCLFHLYMMFLV